MNKKSEKGNSIRDFIVDNIGMNAASITKLTAERFGISRQAVNRYLLEMLDSGLIEANGKGRGMTYRLKTQRDETVELDVAPELEEDRVWTEKIHPRLPELPQNILDICQYGFTEMLNNVIDHSASSKVLIHLYINAREIEMVIRDYGVGIFNKIQRHFHLPEPRDAILELAKGKLTSDPSRHSGEGIFYTSRMFDLFLIFSGNLQFIHLLKSDIIFENHHEEIDGTEVRMKINRKSKLTMQSVFDQFAPESENYGFSKTIIPVRLLQYKSEALVSRSQAKRLYARFENFKEVLLDFEGIGSIGQAFADEMFRVFCNLHPDTRIRTVNASEAVEKMIAHVRHS